jgi:16S rRNA (cytosine1402-N4)-methyltransferase
VHPATLVFQALRIAVNDELGQLTGLLEALPALLQPGGRAVFIAFHSLEDRLVKHRFRALCERHGARGPFEGDHAVEEPEFFAIARKAVIAGEAESAANPRARSAKLRAISRRTHEEAR